MLKMRVLLLISVLFTVVTSDRAAEVRQRDSRIESLDEDKAAAFLEDSSYWGRTLTESMSVSAKAKDGKKGSKKSSKSSKAGKAPKGSKKGKKRRVRK